MSRRMTLAAVEAYCASRTGAVLSTPFGPTPNVYKTRGKIFALCSDRGRVRGQTVSLKCDPERSALLRLTFPAITSGYHLNKTHWNTIALDGTVPPGLIRELIDHAHDIVGASKKKPTKSRPRSRSARR